MTRDAALASLRTGPVLAGVDDDRAAEVVAFAAALAADTGRRLLLVHVCAEDALRTDARTPIGTDAARLHARRAAAERWLGELEVPASPRPVGVARRVVTAAAAAGHTDVAETFARLAVEEAASLLVVGGDLGGHVARDLAATAPCPVAVVPRGATPRAVRTIGVAYDGGLAADAAHAAALALARSLGAAVTLLAVAPDDDLRAVPSGAGGGTRRADELDRVVRRLVGEAPEGVVVHGRVLRGRASHELVVASFDADLIVCGTRARGPLGRLLLGSVSSALMRFGDCPVIVLPPGPAAAAAAGAAACAPYAAIALPGMPS